MVSWYSEGIYSFREEIYQALDEVVNTRGVYEKLRFDTNGQYVEQDDYVSGEKGEFPLIVLENGMHFAVDLNDGAMTGIFLISGMSEKRCVINMQRVKLCSIPFLIQGRFL